MTPQRGHRGVERGYEAGIQRQIGQSDPPTSRDTLGDALGRRAKCPDSWLYLSHELRKQRPKRTFKERSDGAGTA